MNSEPNTRLKLWPVDPREYPLSGPTKGHTYAGSYEPYKATGRPWLIFLTWVAIGGCAAMFGAVAVLLGGAIVLLMDRKSS